MNDKVVVFGQRRAGVYLLSEIYNPDNVKSSVQNVGTVIPAVGSLVVDDSVTEHNTLYVVYSVDAVTFKTTLVPAAIPVTTDIGDDQIVTYGNNIYMVYYQKKENMPIANRFAADTNYYTRTGTGTPYDPYIYTKATVTVGSVIIRDKYYLRHGTGTELDPYYYTLVPEYIYKTLWEMNIDNKISIFGTSAKTFSIYKGSTLLETSTNSIVSDYIYDYLLTSDDVFMPNVTYYTRTGSGTTSDPYVYTKATVVLNDPIPENTYYVIGLVNQHRAPMEQILVPTTDISGVPITTAATKPVLSLSEAEIVSGENYVFAAYDGDNRLIAQITLVAHETLGLSTLAAVQYPIEKFAISANQIDPEDGKCFLVRGQSVDELHFYATIHYSNGDHVTSAEIDNTQLFIYGLEEISTAIPNNEYTVMFKYYLGNNESSTTGKNYHIGDTGRYIYTTATVKIIEQVVSTISKIALIVGYNSTDKYQLFPFIYYKNRQQPAYPGNSDWLVSSFKGDKYITPQVAKIMTYETLSESEEQSKYNQTYQITLFNPDVTEDGVYYYYRDEPSDTGNYYGKNNTSTPRPCIYYENVEGGRYIIPSTLFQTENMFLNSFYYKADPPVFSGEVVPQAPSHFQIRKIDWVNKTTTVVTPSPISVHNYANNIAITQQLFIDADYPNTCIVEFLYTDDPSATTPVYQYLFGVPVDVIQNILPSGVITTEQFGCSTYDTPHYSRLIGEFAGVNYKIDIYASGSVDDCLEIRDASGNILFTDHDASVSGRTHSYSGQKLIASLPKNTAIKIYAWDTAYSWFSWSGRIWYTPAGQA